MQQLAVKLGGEGFRPQFPQQGVLLRGFQPQETTETPGVVVTQAGAIVQLDIDMIVLAR